VNLHTRSLKAALGAAACLLLALNARARQASVAVSSLSATSFTFSGTPVGTPSASQTLTLTNTGGAVLNIVTIVIAGPDFSQSNTCAYSVAAGANCAIDIVFDPIAFGTRTGTMTITSNATDSPQTVTLVGMGMGPAVRLSTGALNYPSQLVTTTSAQQTVVLSSVGDEPLSISTIVLTGPFSENDNCVVSGLSSSELNTGQFCTINVFFSPLAGGTATGKMTINDNAFPAQQIIALSGTGADFAVSLSPTSNSVSAGASANYSISVMATGGFSGTVTLGCGGLSAGVGCSFAPDSLSVGGSSAATSTLTVTTTASSRVPPGGHSKPLFPGRLRLRPLWLWTFVLSGLLGLAAFRRRHKGLMLGSLTAAVVLLGALTLSACGSSKSTASMVTSPGTYYLVVTGTTPAGTGSIQNTATFTLVVN